MRKTITVYGMFTTFRHGDSIGEIFATPEARTDSLRSFVEEFADDEELNSDNMGDGELMDVASDHGHEVHTFDSDIDVEIAE